MDEEENKEEKDKETPVSSDEINVLEESKKVVEEFQKANEEKKALIEREEKLLARKETLNALGGGSQAGQAQEKPQEESAVDYMKKTMSNAGGKYGNEE